MDYTDWLIIKLVFFFFAAVVYGFIRRSQQLKQGQNEAAD